MLPVEAVHPELRQDGSVRLTFLQAPAIELGWLRVSFEPNESGQPDGVSEVTLSLAGGLTPSALQRFAWSRWIRVAEAHARGYRAEPRLSGFATSPISKAVLEERGFRVSGKRPGRRGNPPTLYLEVARRYEQMIAEGVRNPTKRIAQEMGYARDTVAGWVRKAREMGELPAGRKGKAG